MYYIPRSYQGTSMILVMIWIEFIFFPSFDSTMLFTFDFGTWPILVLSNSYFRCRVSCSYLKPKTMQQGKSFLSFNYGDINGTFLMLCWYLFFLKQLPIIISIFTLIDYNKIFTWIIVHYLENLFLTLRDFVYHFNFEH